LSHGLLALSVEELLELLLSPGSGGHSAKTLATRCRRDLAPLGSLLHRPVAEIARIPGMGMARACRLQAALALGLRLQQEEVSGAPLSSPAVVFQRYAHLARQDGEVVLALALDTKLRLIHEAEVARGTPNVCAVRPREIYLGAIRAGASSLILVHTHPSGDPSPSVEDIRFTSRVARAGEILGIKLCDHVVLGHARFVSLAERGLLPSAKPEGE
jgi:DNA repair protein RadC